MFSALLFYRGAFIKKYIFIIGRTHLPLPLGEVPRRGGEGISLSVTPYGVPALPEGEPSRHCKKIYLFANSAADLTLLPTLLTPLKNCTFSIPKTSPFSSFYSSNSYKISLRFMGKCDKI